MRTLTILLVLLTAAPAFARSWSPRAGTVRFRSASTARFASSLRARQNSAVQQQAKQAKTLKRVPWTKLRQQATDATRASYAPYSNVHVGAAGITDKGTVVSGCNVENASYGLTNCAEGGMISAYVRTARQRGEKLKAVSIVAGDGKPLAPCGRCRQVLHEFNPDMKIDGGKGKRPISLRRLLPMSFGPQDVFSRNSK